MSSLGLNAVYDEEEAEDARKQAERKPASPSAAAASAPAAVGVAPPVAAAPAAAASVAAAAPPPAPSRAAQVGGDLARQAWSVLNPIHYKPGTDSGYENLDLPATVAHGVADLAALSLGKNVISGVTRGVGKRIEYAIAGVDPTIAAQNAAVLEKARLKAEGAAVTGRAPKLEATAQGRIDPVFSETPIPDATPVENGLSNLDRAKALNAELAARNAAKAATAENLVAPVSPSERAIVAQAMPVSPEPVAPTAPAAPSATVAANPAATGTEVAQATVREQLVAPAEPEIAGKAGAAVKPKGRPAGAKTMTPEQRAMKAVGEQVAGGRNWLTAQFGNDPKAYEQYLQQFNKGAEYPDYKTAAASIRQNLEGPHQPRVPKGAKKQEGLASIPGLLNMGLNALGVYGLMQAYKKGQETGDWSDLGLGAVGQVLGNVAPRAGIGFSLMAPGTLNEGEAAELARRRAKPATID